MCFELHTWSTVLNKAVRAVCKMVSAQAEAIRHICPILSGLGCAWDGDSVKVQKKFRTE